MSIDLSKYQIEKGKATSQEKKFDFHAFLNKDIQILGSGFSDKKKEQFYNNLFTLISAGLDLKRTLELLEDESNAKDKKLIQSIIEMIISGDPFSTALQKSEKFSPYEYESIRIGEETGRLEVILEEIAKFYSKKVEQRRKIVSALSYPVLVLFTAVFAVWFMLSQIVPIFSDVFNRFGGELPVLTRWIISLSEFISTYSIWILTIIIILSIILIWQRKKRWFRSYLSSVILKIPFIGKLTRKIYYERFCKTIALLTSSNVPIIQAFDLVSKMIAYYPIEKTIDRIKNDLLRGESLSSAMNKHSIFETRMISFIRVGEEVNKLDEMFDKLADQYAKESEHQIGILNNIMEPLLIIVLGVVVGFILVALYLPIFKLSTQIM